MSAKLKNTVDQLFHLFEQGEWDEAAKLFSEEAKITGQYGAEIKPISVEAFVEKAKHGPLSKLGKPVYKDRQVIITGTDGFIEQHTTALTIGGTTYELPVCIVGKFDTDGKINSLDEYLDPAPIMKALT